jgi:hypothetical protein
VDVTGWAVTGAELTLGLTLLLGVAIRWTSVASAALLVIFGVSMFVFAGFEAPLNAPVFSAAAAAVLLSLGPAGTYALSVNRLRIARPKGLDTVTAAYPSRIAGHKGHIDH